MAVQLPWGSSDRLLCGSFGSLDDVGLLELVVALSFLQVRQDKSIPDGESEGRQITGKRKLKRSGEGGREGEWAAR